MNDEVVTVPEEVKTGIEKAVEWSTALVVEDQQTRDNAMGVLKRCKTRFKAVMDSFDAQVKAAKAAHTLALEHRKKFTDPLDQIERTIKAAVVKFDSEQERIRMTEQRRLQAEADERARKERESLEKRAAKLKTEERKDALREQAESIVAPVIEVAKVAEKVQGESVSKIWKARIVNPKDVPREWLIVDEKSLNAFARATKGTKDVEGVEFYAETSLRVRV